MMSRRELIDRFFRSQLRLSHLRTLAMLAELGQVRKVAEAFHVTQSAISKQISEIEIGLGEAVVRREGNRLLLTPIGHRLATRARDVLDQLDRTRLEVAALRSGLFGRVVIGSVTTVSSSIVPEAIRRLKRRAPEVTVAIEEDSADRLLARLASGHIALAIVRIWHPIAREGLVHRHLMDETLVLVVGSAHPLAGKQDLQWGDAMAYPWIVPAAGSPALGALEALLAAQGYCIPDGQVESISISLNVRLCITDDFVALLPKSLAIQLQNEGRIAILPLDTQHLLAETRAFWRTGDEDPTRQLFLECLVDASQGEPLPAAPTAG